MFKQYIQDQTFLIPPSFRDFLSEDHEAVILSDIVDSLDLSSLYESYGNHFKGTSAYDPSMLFKIFIYAYSRKTFSSRSIAIRMHSDIAFMYLSGNQKPDFRTINRFRKEKGHLLEQIFIQVVGIAHEMGMISFGTLSLDGTKIYANASSEKNETLASLEDTIHGLIQDAETIDDIEDERFGDDDGRQIPEELKTKEGRDKKLREIKEKREKTETLKKELLLRIESTNSYKDGGKGRQKVLEKTKINTTDHEARVIQMKKKDFANGYNAQILSENQIILTTNISSNSSDMKDMIPTMQKFEKYYHVKPKHLLADKGYSSSDNYEYLEYNGIDCYIPTFNDQVALGDYVYDETDDNYTDKDGNTFTFKQYEEKRNDGSGRRMSIKGIVDPDNFKVKTYECKNHSSGKKILKIRAEWHKHVLKQKEKLETERGKKLYSKRQTDVETVFANIKNNLNFDRFQIRGVLGANIEWNMISMAHNLKKIIKYQLS